MTEGATNLVVESAVNEVQSSTDWSHNANSKGCVHHLKLVESIQIEVCRSSTAISNLLKLKRLRAGVGGESRGNSCFSNETFALSIT